MELSAFYKLLHMPVSADELQLLDHISEPVFVLEQADDGRPVYLAFNKKARQKAGLGLQKVIGLDARQVYAGRWGQAAYDQHLLALQTRKKLDYELTLPLSGQPRIIKTTLSPYQPKEHDRLLLIGTSQDITVANDVQVMQVETDALNFEMEDFIHLAAHDLRSPIRNIQTLTNLIRQDFEDLDASKLRLIDMLEKVAMKTTSLISDVIAHAQTAGVAPELVEFSLVDLVNEITGMLDPMSVHTTSTTNVRILGDKTAIQIVLRNLIDNAIKHNPLAPLHIEISAIDTRDNMLAITVCDNGKGFTESGMAFLAGGPLRTDSGFGLAGIKRLVKARGGRLFAEQSPDKPGGIVHFSLPGRALAKNAADKRTSEKLAKLPLL